ncbi:glycosyltransferase [Winogradskyella litorisediminis]|uniref:Glycosyltransferase n=1 Tax=Winogradskyella litorisediminis TaxID=1156618 RepID=A0ABW3N6X4_9FLAO
MKIVIVDNGGKIPALKYGGTERVIWGLGKTLNQLGHKVVYLVPEGSYCDFADVLFYDETKSFEAQIPDDADVIHFNFKVNPELSKPYIITIHGNYEDDTFFDRNSVFLSKNHAERYNAETYVYNGLDWDDYPEVNLNLERTHYHFLGKATWKLKNALGAYSIAQKAKINLKVMGGKKWSEYNLKYGKKFLLNSKIDFLGMVDNEEKTKVALHSKGLIFPVKWHEPFGLAVIESLYCGSAVFSTPYGALNELVTTDVGFTSNRQSELILAIAEADFSPKVCHEYARENFSAKVMTKNYIQLYEKAINGEALNKNQPHLKDNSGLELPFYT